MASPDLRGWNRYTINLLAALAEQGVELMLYSDQPLHSSHLSRLPAGSYVTRVSPPMKYIYWEQRWLARQCTADGVAVLHSPFNFGLPWSTPCPGILTLHDAIYYVYYRPLMSWKQKLSRNALETSFYEWIARTRADRVITVSEHARGEIIRYMHIPADRISVTYEGADPNFHQPVTELQKAEARELYNLDAPYFLYAGGWEERKNVPFLVEAFAAAGLPDVKLVLGGGRPEQQLAMLELIRKRGIEDRAKLLGWVGEDMLPALYAGALAFVYPSSHEGFGLQICEAMAVGCPALGARASSLPEVIGSGGETFSLQDGGELVGLMRRVATDNAYREDLIRRARQRSSELSWRLTAEKTIAVYRDAVETHAAP